MSGERIRRLVLVAAVVLGIVAFREWWGTDYEALCREGAAVPADAPRALVGDCATLLRAKSTLAGEAELDWSADRPMESWQGVIVIDGRVTQLRLRNARPQLAGRIPAALGDLSALEGLDLGGNNLRGGIPKELGRLSRLERLELPVSGLTGRIPKALARLPRLEVLNLGGPGRGTGDTIGAPLPPPLRLLTGSIPSELGDLPRLEVLILGYNDLAGPVPPELGELSQLEIVDLRHNRLTGTVPPEWRGMKSLKSVRLGGNTGLTY